MKTVLFATSFINSTRHVLRYEKYLEYYLPRLNKLGADHIFLIDDGSPLEWLGQLAIPIIEIDEIRDSIFPKVTEKAVIFRFSNNLGRPKPVISAGWWRSFSFSSILSYFYSIDKLIHIESDTYILSDKMFDWLKETNNKWSMPKSKHYGFPETCIQVIPNFTTNKINFPEKPKSNFGAIFSYFLAGESFWNKENLTNKEYIPEYCLPFDEITEFEGDRYGEDWCEEIPKEADYISNITDISLEGVNHKNLKSKQFAINKLIYSDKKPYVKIKDKSPKTAFHSGDMGDVVFSIPLMNELNVKTIYLNPEPWFRTKMKEHEIAFLRPLLESEGFEVKIPKGNIEVDYDLDSQRYKNVDMCFTHLGRSAAVPFGINPDLSTPWLTCEEPIPTVDILINSTPRWKGQAFSWSKVYEVLKDSNLTVAYIGTEFEYSRFFRRNQMYYGKLPRIYIDTAESLKRVIAGCKLFIGNQSLPNAIAQGLGKKSILEVCEYVPNCLSEGENGFNVTNKEEMEKALEIIRGLNE